METPDCVTKLAAAEIKMRAARRHLRTAEHEFQVADNEYKLLRYEADLWFSTLKAEAYERADRDAVT